MQDEFTRIIKEHRESAVLEELPRDLIDAYIREIEKEKGNEGSTYTGDYIT